MNRGLNWAHWAVGIEYLSQCRENTTEALIYCPRGVVIQVGPAWVQIGADPNSPKTKAYRDRYGIESDGGIHESRFFGDA